MGIKLGIVGCGCFAQSFIPLFKFHPDVDEVTLCDIDSKRLRDTAKKNKVKKTVANIDELCKTDVDGVVIMTQPWLHAPQVVQCLEAGKWAYSAVPIISLNDGEAMMDCCDKIIKTCKKTGMHYMMGETSYYRVDAMYARKMFKEGSFGSLVHAEGQYFHDIDSSCNLREVAMRRHGKNWDIKMSGDIPMHYCTHSTSGFLSVEPNLHVTELSALGQVVPHDDWHRADTESGNVFGNETALMRLSNGATAQMAEYRKIGAGYETFRLYGTKGSLMHLFDDWHWSTCDDHKSLTKDEMRAKLPDAVEKLFEEACPNNPYGGHGGSHAYLVHEFVDSLVNRRTPAINAWTAARFFAPGVIAHKSALKDGETLKVPDWGNPPE